MVAGRVLSALRYAREQGVAALGDRVRTEMVRAVFRVCERFGWHVIPVHYYEPIPDTRELDEGLWKRTSAMPGVDLASDRQRQLLDTLREYQHEYEEIPETSADADPHEYYVDNQFYAAVDGESLYAMIRHLDPDRVLEIGGGFSTRLTARALGENGNDAELIVVEPYPDEELRSLAGVDRLIEQQVQEVPLAEFEALEADDVLFIDSSHVLSIGSDVQYEYLEVIPRLAEGVAVHVHDVFFPREYPREWIEDYHLFWNEQYLLQSFLAYNDAFEVLFCGSYLAEEYPEALAAAFESYDADVRPHSFWMRRTEST